jgi:hypothetical protein
LLPSFEPKSRELGESAGVSGGVEPLEEAPKEADPEVLEESTDLLSDKRVKVNSSGFPLHGVGKVQRKDFVSMTEIKELTLHSCLLEVCGTRL